MLSDGPVGRALRAHKRNGFPEALEAMPTLSGSPMRKKVELYFLSRNIDQTRQHQSNRSHTSQQYTHDNPMKFQIANRRAAEC